MLVHAVRAPESSQSLPQKEMRGRHLCSFGVQLAR